MAYSLNSLPSTLSREPHLLSNNFYTQHLLQVISFQPLSRNFNFPAKPQPKSSLQVSQVSFQQQTQDLNSDNSTIADEKATPLPKNYVWVNPKSARASQLIQKSDSFRYDSLVKVAKFLNSCSPQAKDEIFNSLYSLGNKIVEEDAVAVLDNMSNSEITPIVLNYFQDRLKLNNEVVLYNVALKVYKKNRDLHGAEKLFHEMVGRGIKPNRRTFSTMISCARLCSLPKKAVEWFLKMPSFGCEPDDVTYTAVIDAYGRAGDVDMALRLYDRARTEKWRIDAVTFETLIRIYAVSGNFDGCLNVYEEMKALHAKPNLAVYNTLLNAMGRAKRPWQVKTIYNEMIKKGFKPSWGTYAALILAYGRSRYKDDALRAYREMKENGMELSAALYNMLLAMCADVGLISEAIEIFDDMRCSETCKPDSWTYSSLIRIHSCRGNVSEAEATLNRMLEAGLEPNIFVLTSLVQCYGKANRADDIVRTFDWLVELGITPDERFCNCLLNAMNQAPKEELGKFITCIGKANPKLGYAVKLLVDEENIGGGNFREEAAKLLYSVSVDIRRAYCTCLIDLCIKLNHLQRACELLHLGQKLGLYTNIQSRSPTQWSLHVNGLSFGTAATAFHIWVNDLSKALENDKELPPLLGINTGHTKPKFSEKGLVAVFESHLKELNAPFHETPDKLGWFLTTNIAATSWLRSRSSQEALVA